MRDLSTSLAQDYVVNLVASRLHDVSYTCLDSVLSHNYEVVEEAVKLLSDLRDYLLEVRKHLDDAATRYMAVMLCMAIQDAVLLIVSLVLGLPHSAARCLRFILESLMCGLARLVSPRSTRRLRGSTLKKLLYRAARLHTWTTIVRPKKVYNALRILYRHLSGYVHPCRVGVPRHVLRVYLTEGIPMPLPLLDCEEDNVVLREMSRLRRLIVRTRLAVAFMIYAWALLRYEKFVRLCYIALDRAQELYYWLRVTKAKTEVAEALRSQTQPSAETSPEVDQQDVLICRDPSC